MAEDDLPQELVLKRDSVIQEIHAAFAGVDRSGSVSWSETMALESYECTEEECRLARESDKDANWEELVDDESWIPSAGYGGWSFLEPAGYIYYLPAAMIRCIKSGGD